MTWTAVMSQNNKDSFYTLHGEGWNLLGEIRHRLKLGLVLESLEDNWIPPQGSRRKEVILHWSGSARDVVSLRQKRRKRKVREDSKDDMESRVQ